MKKPKRVTPFAQKARGGKKDNKNSSEIELIKIHTAKNSAKLELMTEGELAEIKSTTARNALNLFNMIIEEMQRRIPQMTDEVLATAMLSVWDRSDKPSNKK